MAAVGAGEPSSREVVVAFDGAEVRVGRIGVLGLLHEVHDLERPVAPQRSPVCSYSR